MAFYHNEALLDLADIHRPGVMAGAQHIQVPYLSLGVREAFSPHAQNGSSDPPLPYPVLTRSSCSRATVGLLSSQQSSLSSGMKGHQMILRKWFSGVPSGCRMWTKISSLIRESRLKQVEVSLAAPDPPPLLPSVLCLGMDTEFFP